MITATENYLVSPGIGLMIWSIAVPLLLAALLVTLAKGRWGSALAGLFSIGIGWIVGALAVAKPGSPWDRLLARRAARRT